MTLWYLARGAGLVAFVLLTATTVLGLLQGGFRGTERWPRFALQAVHRNLSLLALGFLALHVTTIVLDTFVHTPWWTVLVPFGSQYRPLYVGLGTLAFDALLLLIATSLLRARLGLRAWRAIHLIAYVMWPLALVHYIGAGTDSVRSAGLLLATAAGGAVAAALAVRLSRRQVGREALR